MTKQEKILKIIDDLRIQTETINSIFVNNLEKRDQKVCKLLEFATDNLRDL